jgi:hypothetical protein
MKRFNALKTASLLFVITLLLVPALMTPANALLSQNSYSWYNTSDTTVTSVAVGDVNGDGINELVAAGYYFNGQTYVADVVVFNAATLAIENYREWILGQSTYIASVALGNLTNTLGLSVVVSGSYYNGATWVGLVVVLSGPTLTITGYKDWIWISDTNPASVSIGNLTGGSSLDIITAGSHYDGTRWVAMVVVFNGATLAIESYKEWVWGQHTEVYTVAVGNLTGGPNLDIVTAGDYFNGVNWIANVVVLNGPTLAITKYKDWIWAQDTIVNSVALGNLTGGTNLDIVTAGNYFSGTNWVGDVVILNGATMAIQTYKDWLYGQNTFVNSVAVGNLTGSKALDVVTGGYFDDGVRTNGQIGSWNSSTLASNNINSWFTISNTTATSVAIGNTGAGNRVVQGGVYWDTIRSVAQVNVWG